MVRRALIIGLCMGGFASAEEPEFPWPAMPVRAPLWDREFAPARSLPGEHFTDLLRQTLPSPEFRSPLFLSTDQRSTPDPSSLKVIDRLDPTYNNEWRTEKTLLVPLPVADSLFMFGSFDSSGDGDDPKQLRWHGKTGIGWKWVPIAGSELQVRSGPVMRSPEWIEPGRLIDRSQWSVELQARIDLFGPLQLKYSGEALPALTATERLALFQDIKLAVPFGLNREVHVGARFRWEDSFTPTPWLDRTELYLGIKLKR